MAKKIIFIFMFIAAMTGQSFAYWVWTPDTGKWVNPRYAVKDTPQEQYDWAQSFYNKQDYKRSRVEFEKLVKFYPHSRFASDAQYFAGKSLEAMDEFYAAYQAYQKVVDKYPYTDKIDDILQSEYRIGSYFFEGHKSKVLGIQIMPAMDKAAEIFKKVIDNAPFGKYADQAYYKLGLTYIKLGQYTEGQQAFKKLIETYPESRLIDEAKYQNAVCLAALSPGASYNQDATDEALKKFSKLPLSAVSKEVQQAKDTVHKLREKRAKHSYDIGEYYRKNGKYEGAKAYYEEVIKDFSDTSWAGKSKQRLSVINRVLERKKK